MKKKISRKIIISGVIIAIGAVLTYAFWPQPMVVDMGEVKRSHMRVTISEEGRTRVHDAYVVSTPVAGRLLRMDVEPGDLVVEGKSVIAKMEPSYPTLLDVRSKAQAGANLSAAKAALELARTEQDRAVADKELANLQLKRMRHLILSDSISQLELDRVIHETRTTSAALRNAQAAIAVQKAEVAKARAQLISFGNNLSKGVERTAVIPIHAPATGSVLRIIQESESTLPAGTPVIEIGNIENDLEVVVELLSSDAVQVSLEDQVILTDWGGPHDLNGVVERVDPRGFTKISALGVEEQRVNVIVSFANPPENLNRLGHGYRIEVQIVIWEDKNAIAVPSSALFRQGRDWAVFVVINGMAKLRRVQIGQNNGIKAQVKGGLEPGQLVVLYPSSELTHGTQVSKREVK